jgi:hypothetical protein
MAAAVMTFIKADRIISLRSRGGGREVHMPFGRPRVKQRGSGRGFNRILGFRLEF